MVYWTWGQVFVSFESTLVIIQVDILCRICISCHLSSFVCAYNSSFLTGATVTASVGENSFRSLVQDDLEGFHLRAPDRKSAFLADSFGSVALTAQHGTFQRRFVDLTRFYTRLDFPSGSKFLSGATLLARDFFNSQQPSLETIRAVCPNVFLSVQQQVPAFLCESPSPMSICCIIKMRYN